MKQNTVRAMGVIAVLLLVAVFSSCSPGNGRNRLSMNIGRINAISHAVPDMPKVMAFQASYKPGNSKAVPAQPFQKIKTAVDPVADACLQCHGPFEDLMKDTADYVNEWGITVNPHTYVNIALENPHKSTDIIACTTCHEAHPIPPTGDMDIKQANLQYCYSCHHDEEFVSCSTCHG